MSDITQLLDDIRGGDADASERLLELVYEELRLVTSSKLARETGIKLCRRRHWSMMLGFAWVGINRVRGGVVRIFLELPLRPSDES